MRGLVQTRSPAFILYCFWKKSRRRRSVPWVAVNHVLGARMLSEGPASRCSRGLSHVRQDSIESNACTNGACVPRDCMISPPSPTSSNSAGGPTQRKRSSNVWMIEYIPIPPPMGEPPRGGLCILKAELNYAWQRSSQLYNAGSLRMNRPSRPGPLETLMSRSHQAQESQDWAARLVDSNDALICSRHMRCQQGHTNARCRSMRASMRAKYACGSPRPWHSRSREKTVNPSRC